MALESSLFTKFKDTIIIMIRGAFKTGAFFIVLFLISGAQLCAQSEETNSENSSAPVKRYTLMEKFEPDLVVPLDERKRLKEERKQMVVQRKNVLDTMSISDRRRSRLLRELNENPFSTRINRAFADIKFEDDDPDAVDQD